MQRARDARRGLLCRSGAALVAFLFLAVAATPAAADYAPPGVSIDGPGQDAYMGASGIAADPAGGFLVVDRWQGRVRRLTETGEFAGWFGRRGTDPEYLQEPLSIHVGRDRTVYVASLFSSPVPGPDHPGGTTVRVERFSPEGVPLGHFVTYGDGYGRFHAVIGITSTPDGDVFVAEPNGSSIGRFTADGAFVDEWGTDGDGPGQLQNPWALDGAPDGTLYVADSQRGKVIHFQPDGTFIEEWGVRKDAVGGLVTPTSVAVLPNGEVLVGDTGRAKHLRFSAHGEFLGEYGNVRPGDLAVSGEVVAVLASNQVEGVSSAGFARLWRAGHNLAEYREGEFFEPHDVAVDDQGRVYVAAYFSRHINVYDGSTGAFLRAIGGTETKPGKLANIPMIVELGPDGDVWVAVAGKTGGYLRFSASGEFKSRWVAEGTGGDYVGATDFAIAPDGSLYFVGPYAVFRWAEDGTYLGKVIARGGKTIAIGPWGDIFVADANGTAVRRYDAAGTLQAEWETPGDPYYYEVPSRLDVDPWNNVYVPYGADLTYPRMSHGRVGKYSEDGVLLDVIGDPNGSHLGLHMPHAVAVDGAGTAYVADWDRDLVEGFVDLDPPTSPPVPPDPPQEEPPPVDPPDDEPPPADPPGGVPPPEDPEEESPPSELPALPPPTPPDTRPSPPPPGADGSAALQPAERKSAGRPKPRCKRAGRVKRKRACKPPRSVRKRAVDRFGLPGFG